MELSTACGILSVMARPRLVIRYVDLGEIRRWDRNPKPHDLGALIASFKRHGFRDAMIFDSNLNGGSGGIVAGNGRAEALAIMRDDGDEPPIGVALDKSGSWLAPVVFGVDARSQEAAEAFGLDHNSLTVMGGDFGPDWQRRLYDLDPLTDLLQELAAAEEVPVSIDEDDLDDLLTIRDFDPVDMSELPRLDRVRKRHVKCPKCGNEFSA